MTIPPAWNEIIADVTMEEVKKKKNLKRKNKKKINNCRNISNHKDFEIRQK